MGITIHYGATLNKKDKKLIPKVLDFVQECAVKFGYEHDKLNNLKGYAEHNKCLNMDNEITHEWFSFWEFGDEKDKDLRDDFKESKFLESDFRKRTTQETILIHNKVNGQYMSESFEVGFYLNPFTKKYEWRGFTKTQIFNEKETIPNLKFHIFVIKVLEQIKLRFIPKVKINDEAHFFFTEEERQEQIKRWTEALKDPKDDYYSVAGKYLKEYQTKKPYDFKELVKSHTGNLRLIGSIGQTLEGLGYNKTNIQTPVNDGNKFLELFYKKVCQEI